MTRPHKPLQIIVYQDVLCGLCYVAEKRLELLRGELGETVRWSVRPFPLRVRDNIATARERAQRVEDLHRARHEREGAALVADLWMGSESPRSTVPSLIAVEAARLQGERLRGDLVIALRRAALEQGIDATRPDVIFELASRVGLEMNRFVAAFQSPQTKRLVLEEHRLATQRGVTVVPTVVLGGRWMLSGLRDVDEYRGHIVECLQKHTLATIRTSDSSLH